MLVRSYFKRKIRLWFRSECCRFCSFRSTTTIFLVFIL